jgi:RNA polymerase primary sigma factor
MYEIELSSDRREDASLQHYLQTIGKYRLLKREEEFELARRIRHGDKQALDRLVNANLRFVVSIAKRFLNHGLSYMDLIAEGNVGLITAAKRFDERREFRFISYAVWWIRQTIQKAIADQTNTVRLPINRTQQAQKMKRVAQVLEQRHKRKVSEEEIAAVLKLAPKKMHQIRAASRPLVSIDESLYDDDLCLGEMLVDGKSLNPEQGYLENELQVEMSAALGYLNRRERSIIARYYGLDDEEPASLETIGHAIHLSRERVRQIRNQALTKLRQAVVTNRLKELLH